MIVPRPTFTIFGGPQAKILNQCWLLFFFRFLSGDQLFFIFRFSVAQALKIFFGFPFGYFSLITCSFNSFRNFAFYNYTRLQNIWRSNIWLVFLKSFFSSPPINESFLSFSLTFSASSSSSSSFSFLFSFVVLILPLVQLVIVHIFCFSAFTHILTDDQDPTRTFSLVALHPPHSCMPMAHC